MTVTSAPPRARGWTPYQTWTVVIAGFAVFMTALDNLVVVSALPAMRTDLHASLPALEWTVNAYMLAFACLLMTGAALGDRFGRRRTFVAGLALFTAASALAGLSTSTGMLIGARIAQGAGAAIVFPLTLTLISEAFPPESRGAVIGKTWGGIAGFAVAGGPLVGGAVTSTVDWHWIFWLNVPVGIALIPLAARQLSESYGPRTRIDAPGVVLGAAGTLGLTWALVRGGAAGWTSAEVLGSAASGAALLVAFVLWQRRAPSPVLRLSLFRRPAFTGANLVMFFMSAALTGSLFLTTQYLQLAHGLSPVAAGAQLLPWTAMPMLVMPLAGTLADRYGNRPFMVAGLAIQAAALALLALLASPDVSPLAFGVALGLAGVGISLCYPTVTNAALGSVPPPQAGIASGTSSTLRELGSVFGVALLSAVFAARGAYHSPPAIVHGYRPALLCGAALSALGLPAALLSSRG